MKVKNLTDNPNLKAISKKGCYTVYEHQKDLSVYPSSAATAYFMSEMNMKRRQVLCMLSGNAVKVQAGAMQWMAGNVNVTSDVKGAKDFLGKALKSVATSESLAKPVYSGNGCIMFEPTYKYIILENLADWNGGMVLDDGLFLACDDTVREEIVARKNISSALLGGEGLFNLSLCGSGIAVLESLVPREELVELELENDTVKIDGNMAVAWSKTLDFTVEKATSSLVGSAISGEGFVNVYRGTGRILMAPTLRGTEMKKNNSPVEAVAPSSHGIASSIAKSMLDL